MARESVEGHTTVDGGAGFAVALRLSAATRVSGPLCLVVLLSVMGCDQSDREAPRPSDAAVPPEPGDSGQVDAGQVDAGQVDAGSPEPMRIAPEPNLRVAFLGDQGLSDSAVDVLELIEREHADMVVHAGDFDYEGDPEGWDAMVTGVLGPDFPYFAAVGNHDVDDWSTVGGYRDVLLARLARVAGASCQGDYGVNAFCRYRGLAFVLSGVGTYGDDHESYLESVLSPRKHVWQLCIWHKNQHDMQLGPKEDEVGWEAYRTCAAHGAPIITGHEHSYERTFTLLDVGALEAGHGAAFEPSKIELQPGRTFVVVSGLGGKSRRSVTEEHDSDTWWASIYARHLQVRNRVVVGHESWNQFGALFVDFNVDGDPYKARGYFKTVDDEVVDDFVVTTR